MTAWEEEKATDDYKKRVRMSEKAIEERKQLKNQAHAARRNLVHGIKIHHDIRLGLRLWDSLSADEKTLLDEFNSGNSSVVATTAMLPSVGTNSNGTLLGVRPPA